MTTTTEAMRLALDALDALHKFADSRECRHESTHRGGAIWTICDDCGRKWADDRDPFKPWVEPAEFSAADAAITALRAALAAAPQPPAAQQGEAVAYLWQHAETGRTRIVMLDQVVTVDAQWHVVGPLVLATQPAAAPQPVARGDVPPVLVRDLAEIIGVGVPSVCAALLEIGRPPRSTNMAIGGEEAVAVAKRLAAAPAGVAGEPVAWMNSENQRDPIGAEKKRDLETINGAPGRALAAKYTVPLYTAPPARQALTDSRLHEIWQASWHGPSAGRDYGRAVMRACAAAWGVTLVGIGGKGGANG